VFEPINIPQAVFVSPESGKYISNEQHELKQVRARRQEELSTHLGSSKVLQAIVISTIFVLPYDPPKRK
jgi:hypothetical protein